VALSARVRHLECALAVGATLFSASCGNSAPHPATSVKGLLRCLRGRGIKATGGAVPAKFGGPRRATGEVVTTGTIVAFYPTLAAAAAERRNRVDAIAGLHGSVQQHGRAVVFTFRRGRGEAAAGACLAR
jgi:hypothetical protein